MTTPKEFFDDYVRRSYESFKAKPHDEYLAKNAVHHANVMAARMWHYYQCREPGRVLNATNESDYRDRIVASECDDFAIVRDIDDGFKHVQLTRRTRRISGADQTAAAKVTFVNNTGQEVGFVNDTGEAINFIGNVIVRLDGGSERQLLPILEEVVKMWERLSA